MRKEILAQTHPDPGIKCGLVFSQILWAGGEACLWSPAIPGTPNIVVAKFLYPTPLSTASFKKFQDAMIAWQISHLKQLALCFLLFIYGFNQPQLKILGVGIYPDLCRCLSLS